MNTVYVVKIQEMKFLLKTSQENKTEVGRWGKTFFFFFFIKARQVETRGDKRIRDKTRSKEKTTWRTDGTRGYLGTRQG